MWDPKQDISISDEKASGFDSAVDSGYLSGPQSQIQSSSEISIQEDKKIIETRNICDNLDSGLIKDIEEEEEESSEKQANDIQMLLDSGVGLSEWFCNLSVKNNTSQPLNNFGKPISKKSASIKQSNSDWEIYYQKNEDGDT